MSKKDINFILKNGRENKHDEVLKHFLMLDEADKLNEMVMIAYADSLYELGNDLAALDAYLKFVKQHANSDAVDVALFGAAVALKNLGLQEDAVHVLQLISPKHQGRIKEIEHSRKLLSEQDKARTILGRYRTINGLSLH